MLGRFNARGAKACKNKKWQKLGFKSVQACMAAKSKDGRKGKKGSRAKSPSSGSAHVKFHCPPIPASVDGKLELAAAIEACPTTLNPKMLFKLAEKQESDDKSGATARAKEAADEAWARSQGIPTLNGWRRRQHKKRRWPRR